MYGYSTGKAMPGLVLGLLLTCAAWGVLAADSVEKGAEDLLRNSTLSRPFTILDQLLLNLDRRAGEVAKQLRPEKNDFRLSRVVSGAAYSSVAYDTPTARTAVKFDITVSGIDDPWRDVCVKHLKDIVVFGLKLPYNKEWNENFKITASGFFRDFLGPRLTSDDAQLANYRAFSDSIVVALKFAVESGDRTKPLKFLRQCFLDNKTGQVSFQEHKY